MSAEKHTIFRKREVNQNFSISKRKNKMPTLQKITKTISCLSHPISASDTFINTYITPIHFSSSQIEEDILSNLASHRVLQVIIPSQVTYDIPNHLFISKIRFWKYMSIYNFSKGSDEVVVIFIAILLCLHILFF